MFTSSIRFAGRKGARGAAAAIVALSVLLTGCAGTVTNAAHYSAAPQVRPDTIYVYSFASSPDQVKLDNSGLLKKVESAFSGTTAQQKQAEQAVAVREQVANEIVHQLQKTGLRAIRSDAPAPAVASRFCALIALASSVFGNTNTSPATIYGDLGPKPGKQPKSLPAS